MSLELFKKTPAEKHILKSVKLKYNQNKKKLNPNYTKRKSILGLYTNDFTKLSELLKMAEQVELASIK